MASVKVPPKRLNNVLDSGNSEHPTGHDEQSGQHDHEQQPFKKTKFEMSTSSPPATAISAAENDSDSNIDISSYNTPPPSSFSESRDRSLSPNEENNDASINNGSNDDTGTTTDSNDKKAVSQSSELKQPSELLQNNVKYISLCSALSLLRSQRAMVNADILKLNELKTQALNDPTEFVKQLGNKKGGSIVNSIPKKIHIINGDLNKLFK